MIVAGCDIGSLATKAVVLLDEELYSSSIVPGSVRPNALAVRAITAALERVSLRVQDLEYVVATGYGRAQLPIARTNVSEITCHARAVSWLSPSVRTIIDIGGQDVKVIALDAEHNVEDFRLNDKCAAGTGRFLEVMAKALELGLDGLSRISLDSKHPCTISNTCSVFAETEVVTLAAEGAELQDIAAGIHKAIVNRLVSMVKSVGFRADFTVTGGVAKNEAVVRYLEAEFGPAMQLPHDPQIMGAFGAALIARERALESSTKGSEVRQPLS